MTTHLITVSVDTFFEKIKSIFDTHSFHHLPVMNLDGTLGGIISREDWLSHLRNLTTQTSGRTWTKKEIKVTKAKDLMTPYPMVLDPDDNIGLAADIFLANKFHSLPIVEDNELIGILTTYDLLRYAYASPIASEAA